MQFPCFMYNNEFPAGRLFSVKAEFEAVSDSEWFDHPDFIKTEIQEIPAELEVKEVTKRRGRPPKSKE